MNTVVCIMVKFRPLMGIMSPQSLLIHAPNVVLILSKTVDLVQCVLVVIDLFLVRTFFVYMRRVDNWWLVCSNLVGPRECSKSIKIIAVFHAHKRLSQNDDYCFNAFLSIEINVFGSFVKFLVKNFILRNCILHFIIPMEWNPIYVMYMVTIDPMPSAQAHIKVDIDKMCLNFELYSIIESIKTMFLEA